MDAKHGLVHAHERKISVLQSATYRVVASMLVLTFSKRLFQTDAGLTAFPTG